MKFVPAFLFLGFFSVLAYMVWTNQYPYHLLPEDPNDPNRLARAQETVKSIVGYFGSLKTGLGLVMAGAIMALYFVMERPEKFEP